MNKQVELKKKGTFFEAKHKSAYILWYLLDYKVIDSRVGFPISALEKVLNTLERYSIHTVVITNVGNEIYKNGKNEFEKILNLAKEKFLKNKEIEYIKEKLLTISDTKREEIIDYLYGVL